MVAIIAVSASIAIPAVQAGQRQREVRQTLQHFVAALREASSRAVMSRRSVELWVRKSENAYELALPLAQNDTPVAPEAGEARDKNSELDDLERAEQRQVAGRITLPISASFGEILGGRALAEDVVAFAFSPTGGSSGGQIELIFDHGGSSKTSYTIAFDPLISAIELKQEGA